MLKIIKIICFIIIILFTQTQYANELLIYADDINYDSQENIDSIMYVITTKTDHAG